MLLFKNLLLQGTLILYFISLPLTSFTCPVYDNSCLSHYDKHTSLEKMSQDTLKNDLAPDIISLIAKGQDLIKKGAYRESIIHLKKTLALISEMDSTADRFNARIYNGLAIAFTHLNLKFKGLDYFERSLACNLRNPEIVADDLGLLYRNLARANYACGKYETSIEYCHKAIDLLEGVNESTAHKYFDLYILASRAGAHRQDQKYSLNNLSRAEDIYERFRKLFSDRDTRLLCKAKLKHYRNAEDSSKVLLALQSYERISAPVPGNEGTLDDLLNHHFTLSLYNFYYLDAHQALWHNDRLFALQCHTDKISDININNIQRPGQIIRHIQLRIHICLKLWKSSSKPDYLLDAMHYADLGNRVITHYSQIIEEPQQHLEFLDFEYDLWDTSIELYYQSFKAGLATLNEFWLAVETAKGRHISKCLSKYPYTKDPEHIELRASDLLAETEKASFLPISDLHTQDRKPGKEQISIPSIEMIQERLGKGECLLNYFYVTHKKTHMSYVYSILIGKDTAFLSRKSVPGFEDLITHYIEEVSHSPLSFSDKTELLTHLKKMNLHGGRIRSILLDNPYLNTISSYIIVPHKSLYYIPFTSLPSHYQAIHSLKDWYTHTFLIEHWDISLAFSAKWWYHSIKPVKTDRELILNASHEQGIFSESNFSSPDTDISFVNDFEKLSQKLSSDTFGVLTINTHSSYHNFDQLGYFHISPGDSFIVNDILYFPLQGLKVILSSCETALGAYNRSEGALSFAYHFAAAGAQAICASLWKIPDYQTALILKESKIQKSKLSEEIASGVRNYLQKQKGLSRHPYYWAGLQCFQVDQDEQRSKNQWLHYILACFVLWGCTKKIVTRSNG